MENNSGHQQALLQKHAQERVLRAFHAQVCELLEGERGPELIIKAQTRVRLWKAKKLCSSYFIQHWETVLSSPGTDKFKALVLDPESPHSLGLMQNTPFSFLMTELGGPMTDPVGL